MCDLGGTQTHDLQNRNLTLYSTKLPGQMRGKSKHNLLVSQPLRRFIFVWWASKGKVTEKQDSLHFYVLKSVFDRLLK